MEEKEINGSEYKYKFYFHIWSVTERIIEETILEGRRSAVIIPSIYVVVKTTAAVINYFTINSPTLY